MTSRLKESRGFARVTSEPDEARKVVFTLAAEQLAFVDVPAAGSSSPASSG